MDRVSLRKDKGLVHPNPRVQRKGHMQTVGPIPLCKSHSYQDSVLGICSRSIKLTAPLASLTLFSRVNIGIKLSMLNTLELSNACTCTRVCTYTITEIFVPLHRFVLIPNTKWCLSFYIISQLNKKKNSMMKADFCQLFKLQNHEL